MLFRHKYLIFIFFLIFSSGAASQGLAEPPKTYLPALMDTLMGGHYNEAHQISALLQQEYPAHPVAQYSRIAILYSHMIDLEDTSGYAEFMTLVDSCVERCDLWQENKLDDRAYLAWIKGSALSSRGMILYRAGNKLAGLRQLMSARGDFEEAISRDTAFYDALLGRGTYRSAVGRNASLLSWLPLIPNKEEGWRDLEVAAQKSRWSRYAAINAMSWFALDDRNYRIVDSLTSVGLARFPESRSFLWPRMAMYERQHMWKETAQIAETLLQQYIAHPDNNGYETTGLYWRLMQCSDSLGKPVEAEAFARAGLSAYRSPAANERRQEKLIKIRERLGRAPSNTEQKSGE